MKITSYARYLGEMVIYLLEKQIQQSKNPGKIKILKNIIHESNVY